MVSGDAAVVEIRRQHLVGFERAEVGRYLGALGGDRAAVVHRDAGQPGSAELQVVVGRVAVLVGDVEEDVLAADRVGFDALEFIADGRRHLEPGAAGAHDRIHLGRAESAGGGVVGAGRAGVRVGAGQYFSRPGQPVLGDDLMADAVAADVVEAFDAELGGELAGKRSAGGVLDGRRGDGVVHHDRQLVGIMDAKRLQPHRRELQVDQHGHVDVDDDGVARRRPDPARPCGRRSSRSWSCPSDFLQACVFGVEVQPLRHPDQVEELGGPTGQVVGDVAAVEFAEALRACRARRGPAGCRDGWRWRSRAPAAGSPIPVASCRRAPG